MEGYVATIHALQAEKDGLLQQLQETHNGMLDSKERAAAAEHQQSLADRTMKDAEQKWDALTAEAEANEKLVGELTEYNRKLVQEKDSQTIELTRLSDLVAKAHEKAKRAGGSRDGEPTARKRT